MACVKSIPWQHNQSLHKHWRGTIMEWLYYTNCSKTITINKRAESISVLLGVFSKNNWRWLRRLGPGRCWLRQAKEHRPKLQRVITTSIQLKDKDSHFPSTVQTRDDGDVKCGHLSRCWASQASAVN